MKRIILLYTLLGLIYSFTLVSYQKKEQISTNNKNQKKDLKNYLKIPVDTDISLLIGELVSTNENIKTREREVTDCEFTINSGENPVILIKCE